MSTLLFNLVSSLNSKTTNKDEEWMQEYMDGCTYEIYRIGLSSLYTGLTFLEAATVVYEETGAVMFALQLVDTQDNRSRVLLNPQHLFIPCVFGVAVKA